MSLKNLPLTGLPVGLVPAPVIVCGDPRRASQVAEHFQQSEMLSDNREYRAYKGDYKGMAVAVCSHGIGSPGAAIAFEELIRAGARQLIRVGTCGGLQPEMTPGELVIATAAMQNTGYGKETVPSGYPAVADLELTMALKQVATARDHSFHCGIVLSRDNFYQGVELPDNPHYPTISAANVLAVEMECAALFIVGNLRGIQTAAILAVDGNVLASGGEKMDSYSPGQDSVQTAVTAEIEIALQTLYQVNHDPV